MTRSKLATTCAALMLSLLVWTARPARVEAQTFSLCADGCPALVAVGIVGVAAQGFVLGLGIADLVSYGIDSPWDQGWAIVDIVVGSLCAIGGLSLLSAGLSNEAQGTPSSGLIGAGVGYTAWGTHLLMHGVWSLTRGERAPPVSVAVSGEGVQVSARASF